MSWSTPGAALGWLVFMGFIASTEVAPKLGLPAAWVFFLATAPLPLSGWRYMAKERNNLFDWLGYAAGAGGWLFFMSMVKQNFGLHPLPVAVGGALGLIPAGGIYGLFSIPAFILDHMPKRAPRRKRKAQMPYSETASSDLGFDPSRFGNMGGPGRPGPSGGYQEPGQGPQGSPRSIQGPGTRTRKRPEWATEIIESVRLKYEADRQKKEQAAREAREMETRERGARARAEREHQQQEEIKRLRQRSADDDYENALDLFDLKDGYTLGELRKRYNALVHEAHPDKSGTSGLFRKVHEAFQLLSKKAK